MSFVLKKAIRENVGLIVGLAGGTGSGKTFSAMRLAAGVSGKRPFAVIDTEAGRAKHYADQFNFDHGELRPPFTPDAYREAIMATDAGGYSAIIVDSASHEHAGEGGILDMHETELDRMAGDDWKKREACKMAAWIKPKVSHKHFIQVLLQLRTQLLILCLRAEEKIEIAKEDGKTVIRAKQGLTGLNGWFPICEKNLTYETTAYFLLLASDPGIPQPIKLQEQHKAIFPLGKLIDEECGRRLLAWASAPGKAPAPAPATLPVDDAWVRVLIEERGKKNGESGETVRKYQIDGRWVVCRDCDLWPMLENANIENKYLWIKQKEGVKDGKKYIEIIESSEIEP